MTALTIAAGLAGLVVLGFAGAFQFLEPELPAAAELRHVPMQLPLQVYSRDGKLIAQIGEQRRIPLEWQEIPPQVVDAFLAAEDDRFFQHPGVDWQGLLRAAKSNLSAGGVREGGGTITMQLARNTILTSERTLRRKLKEVFLALRLEREFSKEEILTLYLNRIFLGQRAYGIGAAAQVYFDKNASELTLAEAALIAGLPRSPSLDNPVASAERARDRRAYVLRRMRETGKIDAAAHDAAAAVPVVGRIHGPEIELEAPNVAEMVRLEMVRLHGDAALTEGFRVTTTVDSRLQSAANVAVRRAMLEYERRHGYRGPLEQLEAAQLADPAAVAAAFKRHADRGGLACALVESVLERGALLRLRNGLAVEVGWDDLAWARPALENGALGPAPKTAADVVAAGQFVYLETVRGRPLPAGPAAGSGGGTRGDRAARRSHRLAGGRLRFRLEQVQPRDPGAPPARVRVQAVRVLGRAGARLHAGEPDQRRADRHAGRRRHRGVAAAEHHQAVLWTHADARGAGAFAQPGLDPPAARDRASARPCATSAPLASARTRCRRT